MTQSKGTGDAETNGNAEPSDIEEASVSEVAAPEVAAPEVDAPEVDAPEVDAPEVDAPEVDAPEVDAPEVDAPEVDAPEVAAPEVAASEVATSEVASSEVAASEAASPEVDAPKVAASEVAASSEPKPNILEVFFTMYSFVVMILMWGGGILSIAVDPTLLDVLWQRSAGLTWPVQTVLWVLLLPLYVSLWVWQADWPTAGRIAGMIGICLWTAVVTWRYINVMLRERRLG